MDCYGSCWKSTRVIYKSPYSLPATPRKPAVLPASYFRRSRLCSHDTITPVLRLNVHEVVHFFDEVPIDSRFHATAVVGVLGEDLGTALLQRRLSEIGVATTVVLSANGHPVVPTLGTGSGERLDRWLLSSVLADGTRKLYQVEIKNWSGHAIGGRKLSVGLKGLTPEDIKRLTEHRQNRWTNQWHADQDAFRSPAVRKVLTRMTPPKNDGRGTTLVTGEFQIEPIICFWDALHPNGEHESLFEHKLGKVSRDGFDRLWVFSMSNYLRSLGEDEIVLDMPAAAQRIAWLHRLFALDCPNGTQGGDQR